MLSQIYEGHIYSTNECKPILSKEDLSAMTNPELYVGPEQITVTEVNTDYVMSSGGLRYDLLEFLESAKYVGKSDIPDLSEFAPNKESVSDKTNQETNVDTTAKSNHADAIVDEVINVVPTIESDTISEIKSEPIVSKPMGILDRPVVTLLDSKTPQEFDTKLLSIIESMTNMGYDKDELIVELVGYQSIRERIVIDYLNKMIDKK